MGLGMETTLRSHLAYTTSPGPSDLVFARPSRAKARRGTGMEVCSYVKRDSWASRPRGLTGHVTPHPLVSSW